MHCVVRVRTQEAACGCAGMYTAPVALALYAHAFEQAGALGRLEGFASFHGADFYGLPRNKVCGRAPGRVGSVRWCCGFAALRFARVLARRGAAGPRVLIISPCVTHGIALQLGRPRSARALCVVHVSQGKVMLVRRPQPIPEHYAFGDSVVVPMWAGQEVPWSVAEVTAH